MYRMLQRSDSCWVNIPVVICYNRHSKLCLLKWCWRKDIAGSYALKMSAYYESVAKNWWFRKTCFQWRVLMDQDICYFPQVGINWNKVDGWKTLQNALSGMNFSNDGERRDEDISEWWKGKRAPKIYLSINAACYLTENVVGRPLKTQKAVSIWASTQ